MKNGLLLHELLRFVCIDVDNHRKQFISKIKPAFSPFGHLDSINSVIRIGTASFSTADAHIRFERATELKPKGSDMIEDVSASYLR